MKARVHPAQTRGWGEQEPRQTKTERKAYPRQGGLFSFPGALMSPADLWAEGVEAA